MSFFLQKVITSATSSRVIIRKMFSAKVTLKFQDSMTGVTGGLLIYNLFEINLIVTIHDGAHPEKIRTSQ